MKRAARILGGAALALGGAVGSGLVAAAVVLVLVLAAGGGRYMDTVARGARSDIAGTYWRWLNGLFREGMGRSWSGMPLEVYVVDAAKTCAFVAGVLGIAVGFSAWMAWRDQRAGMSPVDTTGGGLRALWMAPTVFWAALVIVLFDALVIVVLSPFEVRMSRWLLPNGALIPRYVAAAVVLAFSSGLIWDMRAAMTNELAQVLQRDFIATARANGLDVTRRVLRNLAVPVATRVAGKVPLLLGEVIVAEYFFVLDGAGRQLIGMVEDRDALALMTVTTFFVAVTAGARFSVSLLARHLGLEDEELAWET